MREDTFVYKGKRKALCEELQRKGIKNGNVLEAIKTIPRHFFLPSGFESHAYEDKAFPIIANQTISQPYTVAFQTQLLEVEKGDKILEVGTGSGYQTAILTYLKAKVYTIERQQQLYRQTKLLLPRLGYKPKKMIFGDGYLGYVQEAPYDKIIITAGAPTIPKTLLSQLKIGGKMVIPLGQNIQVMTQLIRKSETEILRENFGNFTFVPMLEDKN